MASPLAPLQRIFDTLNRQFRFTVFPNDDLSRLGRPSTTRVLYAVKASRFLTHMKKPKDPEEPSIVCFVG